MAVGGTAVILGALGVVGRNLLHWLEHNTECDIVGVARRAPDFATRARFIQVDLLDRDATFTRLANLAATTEVYFCGFVPAASWAGHVAPNLSILANGLEAVERAAPGLRHVHLMEGTKYYGSHLGPYRTPSRESDPPHMPPNFYRTQEDWLRRHREGKAWCWSALRPHTVCGFSLRSPMNLAVALAVYASISRELGLPLRFPGAPAAFRTVYQLTDSNLLAKAMHWCAHARTARDEAFNVTNGDFFRWENLWPAIARFFSMEPGGVQRIPLADFMADKADLWRAMQARHRLRPHAYEDLVSWPFADYCLTRDYDVMSDTGKLRRAGFHDCVDSEEMLLRLFAELREERVIP